MTPAEPAGVRLVHVTTVPESLGFLRGQTGFMKARGIEVSYVSSPGPALDGYAAAEGVDSSAVSMSRRVTPWADLVALVRLWVRLRASAPHIVHAHTPKAGLLGMLAARLAGVPVRIYHLRGLPLLSSGGARRALLRLCERVACRCAHEVICVGPSLREVALRERLCPPDKIRVLGRGSGNGVDASALFRPDRPTETERAEARKRLAVPAGVPVIGFVGRIVRDKGAGELLLAWRRLRDEFPELRLVLVGNFESHDPLPQSLLRALRDDPRLRITGEVPRAQMPSIYAVLDVLVVPTYREGFPNVVLEALAMERAVVATAVPGCVDALHDGQTGRLVPVRDADALAVAVAEYLRDDDLRRRHGAAGREWVLRYFRPEEIWQGIHARYLSLLEERGAVTQVGPPGALQSVAWRRPGRVYSGLKRAVDLGVASMGLVVLSPLLAAIALAVLARLGRPVLFRQPRPGRDERLFTLLKFRTMREGVDRQGRALADAERLTRLGRWLRRASLDELPELWNVVRGEMSLIGPRPLLTRYLPYYTTRERLRFKLRPGITGWSQVRGRNLLDWDARLEGDAWYVEHCGPWLDLRILLRTLVQVVRGADVVVDARSALLNLDESRAGQEWSRADVGR